MGGEWATLERGLLGPDPPTPTGAVSALVGHTADAIIDQKLNDLDQGMP